MLRDRANIRTNSVARISPAVQPSRTTGPLPPPAARNSRRRRHQHSPDATPTRIDNGSHPRDGPRSPAASRPPRPTPRSPHRTRPSGRRRGSSPPGHHAQHRLPQQARNAPGATVHAASPTRDNNAVEPTRSVNTTVAVTDANAPTHRFTQRSTNGESRTPPGLRTFHESPGHASHRSGRSEHPEKPLSRTRIPEQRSGCPEAGTGHAIWAQSVQRSREVQSAGRPLLGVALDSCER